MGKKNSNRYKQLDPMPSEEVEEASPVCGICSTTNKGGLIGMTGNGSSIFNCYWDIALIGDAVDEIWTIDDGNQYPLLNIPEFSGTAFPLVIATIPCILHLAKRRRQKDE